MELTKKLIKDRLRQVIDPELGINIVDLGLIYKIQVQEGTSGTRKYKKVSVLMTLTSPGCPLAAVFQPLVRQALADIPGFDQYKDLSLELTFDPPWHQDMMSERAKAEMGL
ncbi:MAG: iron-sulfur cluster assembly protein [Patescibacteria group bacterium]|nr:iron-sulfur cluster assembly protein [Patescibacteria group bacterium]